MGRRWNLPELDPVDQYEVAPHRYLYTDASDWDNPPKTWSEVRKTAKYQKGEVVYVAYGEGYTRAIIHEVTTHRDYFGDLVEAYWLRRETKKGRWSKTPYKGFVGYIQRGYYRAGMAPDIPEGVL